MIVLADPAAPLLLGSLAASNLLDSLEKASDSADAADPGKGGLTNASTAASLNTPGAKALELHGNSSPWFMTNPLTPLVKGTNKTGSAQSALIPLGICAERDLAIT